MAENAVMKVALLKFEFRLLRDD